MFSTQQSRVDEGELETEPSICVFLTSTAICVSCKSVSTSWASRESYMAITVFVTRGAASSSRKASASLLTRIPDPVAIGASASRLVW